MNQNPAHVVPIMQQQKLSSSSAESLLTLQKRSQVDDSERLDIRDRIISIQLIEDINSVEIRYPLNGKQQEFMIHNPLLSDRLRRFLIRACERIFSISFQLLNTGNLGSSQVKDYSSKNLLNHILAIFKTLHPKVKDLILQNSEEGRNIKVNYSYFLAYKKSLEGQYQALIKRNKKLEEKKSFERFKMKIKNIKNIKNFEKFLSTIEINQKDQNVDEIKDMISEIQSQLDKLNINPKEKDMAKIFQALTSFIQQTLRSITSQNKDYYPKANTVKATTNISKTLKPIDRREDFKIDFLSHYREIEFKKASVKIQDKEIKVNILKLLNKLIAVAPAKTEKNKTHYQVFEEFSKNLFWLASKPEVTALFMNNNNKQEKNVNRKLNDILILNNQQHIIELLKSQDKDAFKKFKQEKKTYLQKIKQKNQIGQKIPKDVENLSQNIADIEACAIKNSCLLRILNKWYSDLMDMCAQSDRYIRSTSSQFKMYAKKIEFVKLNNQQKEIFHQLMKKQAQNLKTKEKQFIKDNISCQAYILQRRSKSCDYYTERFLQERQVSSQVNTILQDIMMKLLINIIKTLIQIPQCASELYRIRCQKRIKENKFVFSKDQEENIQRELSVLQTEVQKMKNISLITFKLGDLMRSKIECSEQTFLNILNIFYALDQHNLQNEENKFKLVVIKNKFNEGSSQALVCYQFLKGFQCQLQIILESSSTDKKSHNYHSYNHFLYELDRQKFGYLSGICSIISQQDPILNRTTTENYEAKRVIKSVSKQQTDLSEENEYQQILEQKQLCWNCDKCNYLTTEGPGKFIRTSQTLICINCCIEKYGLVKTLLKLRREIKDTWIYHVLKNLKDSNPQDILEFNKQSLLNLENETIQVLFSISPGRQFINVRFWLLHKSKQLLMAELFKQQNAIKFIEITKFEERFTKNNVYFFKIANTKRFLLRLYARYQYIEPKKMLNQQQQLKKQQQKLKKQTILKEILNQIYLKLNFVNLTFYKQKIRHWQAMKYIKKSYENSIQVLKLSSQDQIMNFKIRLEFLKFIKDIQIRGIADSEKVLQLQNNFFQIIELPSCNIITVTLQFLNPSYIKVLNLRNNNIQEINWIQLSSFYRLEMLDLSQNKLKKAQLKALEPQRQIDDLKDRTINLSQNEIENCVIDGFINITWINLRKNKINKINLNKLPKLKYLNIQENNIDDASFLRTMYNLQILKLTENNISKLNLSCNSRLRMLIARQPSQKRRQLSFQMIKHITFCVEPQKQIERLYLSGVQNHKININQQIMAKIIELSINYHPNPELSKFKILKQLCLIVQTLQNEQKILKLSNIQSLKRLTIKSINQQIQQIDISQFTSLQFLKINCNKLNRIKINNLPNLQNFCLYSKQLSAYPLLMNNSGKISVKELKSLTLQLIKMENLNQILAANQSLTSIFLKQIKFQSQFEVFDIGSLKKLQYFQLFYSSSQQLYAIQPPIQAQQEPIQVQQPPIQMQPQQPLQVERPQQKPHYININFNQRNSSSSIIEQKLKEFNMQNCLNLQLIGFYNLSKDKISIKLAQESSIQEIKFQNVECANIDLTLNGSIKTLILFEVKGALAIQCEQVHIKYMEINQSTYKLLKTSENYNSNACQIDHLKFIIQTKKVQIDLSKLSTKINRISLIYRFSMSDTIQIFLSNVSEITTIIINCKCKLSIINTQNSFKFINIYFQSSLEQLSINNGNTTNLTTAAIYSTSLSLFETTKFDIKEETGLLFHKIQKPMICEETS